MGVPWVHYLSEGLVPAPPFWLEHIARVRAAVMPGGVFATHGGTFLSLALVQGGGGRTCP